MFSSIDVRFTLRNVIKVSASMPIWISTRFREEGEMSEGRTNSLSGERTIVVESLKYNPAVPSVKL